MTLNKDTEGRYKKAFELGGKIIDFEGELRRAWRDRIKQFIASEIELAEKRGVRRRN